MIPWVPEVFFSREADRSTLFLFGGQRLQARAARVKPLVQSGFIHRYWITFLKTMTASISHCDHIAWHMKTRHIFITDLVWFEFIASVGLKAML